MYAPSGCLSNPVLSFIPLVYQCYPHVAYIQTTTKWTSEFWSNLGIYRDKYPSFKFILQIKTELSFLLVLLTLRFVSLGSENIAIPYDQLVSWDLATISGRNTLIYFITLMNEPVRQFSSKLIFQSASLKCMKVEWNNQHSNTPSNL